VWVVGVAMTRASGFLQWAAVLAWLCGTAPSSLARAEEVTADALLQSNALFAQGKREIAAGATVAACVSFAESYRLLPRGGTLLNLGLCHEQAGHLSEAWRTLRLALTTATAEGRTDRIPLASEHIAAVESKLSWVALSLPHDVDPSLVAVRLDGAPVAPAEWGAVPLEVGEHVLTAEALGFESWSQRLAIPSPQTRLHVGVGPLIARRSEDVSAPVATSPTPAGQGASTEAPRPNHPVPYTTPYASFAPYPPAPRYRDPVLLAEQRAARETWFVEVGVGVTDATDDDEYLKTLKAFGYNIANVRRTTYDGALGVMFTRKLGLVAHYSELGFARFETPKAKDTFAWHTQALLLGARFRQPVVSHWLVVFAELAAGVSFTRSKLEYPVAMADAPTGFVERHDDAHDRGLIVRGLVGLDVGFTQHVGAYAVGGYTYAPTLSNTIDEVHRSGGATFLTGLRLHGVKGWW
jgi:hypothetical protein